MEFSDYRDGQRSEIFYVLLTDEHDVTLPFIPPQEFDNYVIRFISRLPKDILQIGIALDYYELALINGINNPYRFHIKYTHNLAEYLDLMPKNMLYLFFIDGKSKLFKEVCSQLNDAHNDLCFYHIFNGDPATLPKLLNLVDGPGEFLTALYCRQEHLFKLMQLPFKELVPEVSVYDKKFYEFPFFVPAQINFHIANSITGNFDFGASSNTQKITEKQVMAQAEASKKSNDEANTFNRQDTIIRQMKKVDYFPLICRNRELYKPVHEIDPVFPPLILVAPFQNPDLKDYFNKKPYPEHGQRQEDLFRSLHFEQSENYINFGSIRSAEAFMAVSHLIGRKTQFLDDVAFLHSSFTFSPVLRLPVQGKTLYRNLSFFRSEASSRITDPKNSRKIFTTINNFGKQFKERAISPKMTKRLVRENRQIVAISDLPVEWLDIDGIPLAFTHDICRLPETALHGLMANFTSHEQLQYVVPKDILKKTLVIFGADEPAFRLWYPEVNRIAATSGVVTRECFSVDALAAAIVEIRPDLLIIDSHGNYDPVTKSSILYLGKERLTGDIVIEKGISAPLIFLSACNTAPTYGTINTIANAFFETKSLAVTTTYLPINVHAGSILYLRLLNNLHLASTTPIHSNWLGFISHLIRTSAIGTAYQTFLHSKASIGDSQSLRDGQAEDYTRLLSFPERRPVYEKYALVSVGKVALKRPSLYATVPEFLFYSTLGRADLIKFESWREQFRQNNPVNLKGLKP